MVRSGPALTVGAVFGGLTITVTLSLLLNAPSDAVNCRTYVPAALKLALVTAAAGAENHTVPGPLTRVQRKVIAPGGDGLPSSDAEPWRLALDDIVMVRSGPALTVGAVFVAAALTITVTVSLALNTLSDAVSCRTYVPAALKLALVTAAVGAENVTAPGPLTRAQPRVMAPGGDGIPSSDAEPWRLAVDGSAIVQSGPALTVGVAFEGVLITSGMLMTASGLAGASTVLPALRAHVVMVYAAGRRGRPRKRGRRRPCLSDLCRRSVHNQPFELQRGRASRRDGGERDSGSRDLRRSVAGRNAHYAQGINWRR